MSVGAIAPVPAGRLGAFYFGYFGALGALVPYFSRYLAAQDYDPAAIGQLMAILGGTRLFTPFLWALVIEKTGRRMLVVRASLLIASLFFAGLLLEPAYFGLTLCLLGFHMFANAVLPQMEAVTMSHLRERPARYSAIRLWGSVGYMVLVVATGLWLDSGGLADLPVLVLLGLLFTVAMVFTVPDVAGTGEHQELPLGRVLHHPAVWTLFFVCLCQQAANQPYYLFYDLLLKGQGYSGLAIGSLIALGVLAEIAMFMRVGRWLERLGARTMMLIVLVLACVRWLLVGTLSHSPAVMIFTQLLHAVTFAAAHATAMYALALLFPGRLQGRAQGLFASLVYGAGGIVGSLLAGQIGKTYGFAYCFYASTALCVLALLLSWRGLHIDRRPAAD